MPDQRGAVLLDGGAYGGGVRDVEICVPQADAAVAQLAQGGTADLAARTRDEHGHPSITSRAERIGESVDQRWTTRSSFHGNVFSSSGLYSCVTW